ncbi:hypothetical protein D1872_37910 [compost metagenome]
MLIPNIVVRWNYLPYTIMNGVVTMSKHLLGYTPSRPDYRDFVYGALKSVDPTNLPAQFDLGYLPVNTQVYGNCVGQSSRVIKYFQEKKDYPKAGFDFSPDFIYNECKIRDGKPAEEGTEPRIAMKVLSSVGAALKADFPVLAKHDISVKANENVYTKALTYRVKSYARLQTIAEVKAAIYNDGPVMLAGLVTEGFRDTKDGFIDYPNGDFLGGHAYTAVGYDDNLTHKYPDGRTEKGFVIIQNSWGEKWGIKGRAYIPYSMFGYRLDIGIPFFDEMWASVDLTLGGADIPPDVVEDDNTETITMWVGKSVAFVNGKQVTLTQPPIINNGSTLAPVRFVAETAGYTLSYNASEKRIDMKRNK